MEHSNIAGEMIMRRRRNIYFIIIISSLIFAVADSFIAKRQSYEKYQKGEYYFRQKARTVDTHSDTWWATPEAQSMDYSDPKNMLLTSGNISVYAYGPHDGVCTVCYNETVIEDFPIKNLKFENDDADYFYGSKTYIYEEYIDIVNNMDESQLKSLRVSDKAMANFKEIRKFMFILIGVDAVLAAILFLLYKAELDNAFNVLMFLGALYSVFFEVVTFFVFGMG